MGASISSCGKYRYRLERGADWGGINGHTVIIMVNPSTADAEQDDPTIRKLLGFAGRWKVVHRMALRAGKEPFSIGPTALDGHPCHPLMLAYDTPLQSQATQP